MNLLDLFFSALISLGLLLGCRGLNERIESLLRETQSRYERNVLWK